MRVHILTDLEGVAGVVSQNQIGVSGGDPAAYAAAKKLLTAEVNAAVEGLLAEGVTDILVSDAHGPGAIEYETLHPAVKLLHGRPIGLIQALEMIRGEYDAAMIVGQHAMAGSARANLNHTQSFAIEYIKVNGRAVGEIGQYALFAGAEGVPVIFLSGDQAACKEVQELIPGVTAVAVKRGVGRFSAISVSAQEARRLIREGAQAAVRAHRAKPVAPLHWPGPYIVEVRYHSTADADMASKPPDSVRVDDRTVQFRGDDIRKVVYRC
ncbi:MAG: M55 family metallopeptidase [Phycisphaerae bacterium]